jgi:DTW domain-containing protein YfiP
MPRAVCPRCGRAACICRWIVPAASGVEVAILQTREEARNAKNSAGLLRLSLAGSALEVADSFDAAQLHALLHAPWPGSAGAIFPILLYPAIEHDPGLGVARAPPLDLAALAGRQPRLVVLDGTWRKSRKLLYTHPALQALPRLGLEGGEGRYLIRKAHAPGQLSTFEAVCAALAALDPAFDPAPLLAAFDGFVGQQMAYRPGAEPSNA